MPDIPEVPDGVAVYGHLPPPPPALGFVLSRLADEPPGPAVDALRELVEWAVGVEELRAWRDPGAPSRAVGAEVLGIIAAAWSGHSDYRAEWDVAGS